MNTTHKLVAIAATRFYEPKDLDPNRYPATYELPSGKRLPVAYYVEGTCGALVPVLDVPMMSDLAWQQKCLQDRLEHRERYEALGEDVDETIARIRAWIAAYLQRGGGGAYARARCSGA